MAPPSVQLESNTEAYFNPDNLADGGALLQSGFYQEPDVAEIPEPPLL
jgi:hypothetical protein